MNTLSNFFNNSTPLQFDENEILYANSIDTLSFSIKKLHFHILKIIYLDYALKYVLIDSLFIE